MFSIIYCAAAVWLWGRERGYIIIIIRLYNIQCKIVSVSVSAQSDTVHFAYIIYTYRQGGVNLG